MPGLKRKRVVSETQDDSEASSVEEVPFSGHDLDISLKLVGFQEQVGGGDDEDFIRQSIAKHNVKSGTELIKKTKGKKKISKGEVGGGSFQSMGMCSAWSPV